MLVRAIHGYYSKVFDTEYNIFKYHVVTWEIMYTLC